MLGCVGIKMLLNGLPLSSGWAPGREDTDFPSGGFSAQLLVRSLQPSGTTISR